MKQGKEYIVLKKEGNHQKDRNNHKSPLLNAYHKPGTLPRVVQITPLNYHFCSADTETEAQEHIPNLPCHHCLPNNSYFPCL